MTVEVTATISINVDGTWNILYFGKGKPVDEKQTKVLDFDYSEPEIEPEFKPASWYLKNARKQQRRRKTYNRGPNHCSRCGMVNKNKLTCLSVMKADGTFESHKHRIVEDNRWI